MCLTGAALATFLNILGAELVSSTPNQITVHAQTGDVVWLQTGAQWCAERAPKTQTIFYPDN